MTAPVPGLKAAEDSTAEALLGALRHVAAPELRKHATVFNYWLSIRRGREVPPIRDLDPLEISDVAPSSLLLELVNGGEDAEIRHLGASLKTDSEIGRIGDAPQPSALSSIAGKLTTVATTKEALAFEETFAAGDGLARCSVTLLPFTTTGDTVDFVYSLVSVETGVNVVEATPEPVAEPLESAQESEPDSEIPEIAAPEEFDVAIESEPEAAEALEPVNDDATAEPETAWQEAEEDSDPLDLEHSPATAKPGFSSKMFDALAGAKGFFGTVASAEPAAVPEPVVQEPEAVVQEPEPVVEEAEPVAEELAPTAEPLELADVEPEPVFEEPAPVADGPGPAFEEPAPVAEVSEPVTPEPVESPHLPMEGTLQSKLVEVRGKAEEAQAAKLRAEAALAAGLSAAYDFALDAENAPEEYLRLVEEQGLKIQLRSPMAPVVKLAFDGSCDESTIKQLESVLAWALKMELPRGSLGTRIAEEGGIGSILSGRAA